MSVPITTLNHNSNYNNNNRMMPHASAGATGPVGGDDMHSRRWEWANHRWNPFPPYTHPAIKAVTTIVILFLIATFIVYVVFVSLSYAKDKDSPKQALKFKNKELKPLAFPAITICNFDGSGAQMSLSSCTVVHGNITGADVEDCSGSVVFQDFVSDVLPCWTVNLKSDLLPVAYKADSTGLFHSIQVVFQTTAEVEAIAISLHEAHKKPALETIFVPHTFTANAQEAILSLQRVETTDIKQHKTVSWECDTSHLVSKRVQAEQAAILVYYHDLRIIERKEEYAYKAVSLIGDIAAAFEILLGLSFFKVYILLLAAYILLGNRSYSGGKMHADPFPHPPTTPVHVGAPTM